MWMVPAMTIRHVDQLQLTENAILQSDLLFLLISRCEVCMWFFALNRQLSFVYQAESAGQDCAPPGSKWKDKALRTQETATPLPMRKENTNRRSQFGGQL